MGHWNNRLGTYYFNGWVDKGFEADLDFHLFELSHQPYKESSDPTPVSGMMALAVPTTRGIPKAQTAGLALLVPLPRSVEQWQGGIRLPSWGVPLFLWRNRGR